MTREEAVVMVARAAELCGMDTAMKEEDVRAVLHPYSDAEKIAGWAQEQIAFCIDNGILERTDRLAPGEAIQRGEIAQMLYRTLVMAELL